MLLLCTGLACGGLLGAEGGGDAEHPVDARREYDYAEPDSAPPEKKMFSYGKPDGWTVEKEEYESDGHKVLHYVLSGSSASVQLILHPPGAPPPSVGVEMLTFKGALAEEDVPVTFGEVEPRLRSLSGEELTGTVLPLTVDFGDVKQQGEHGVWLVQGPKTSCLVVVDVPDITATAEVRAVDEVLARLVVP